MIIDTHTHAFPDAIAERTIAKLAGVSHTTPHHNGTIAGLRAAAKKAGITHSIVLPVVTAPRQFNSINAFAAENNGIDGIISFGGIHPDNDDIENKLMQIRSLGLKGIKLHPDYQATFIDDDKYVRIIKKAIELDLIVILHAGVDIGYPETVHCPPERSLKMLKKVYGDDLQIPKPQIVFAHMGGSRILEDVKKYLAGLNVFFDTAFVLDKLPSLDLMELINMHGAERILFATDSPWGDPKTFVEYFNTLPLTYKEKELILHGNAEKLLGI